MIRAATNRALDFALPPRCGFASGPKLRLRPGTLPGAELPPGGELQVGWEEAKRMRDLLKVVFLPNYSVFDEQRYFTQIGAPEGVGEAGYSLLERPDRADEIASPAAPAPAASPLSSPRAGSAASLIRSPAE